MSKVTPWSASSVFTFGITRIDSSVWSSVMIMTTFGRNAGELCAWPSAPLSAATATIPAARAAIRIRRFEAAIEVESLPRP